MRSVVRPFSLLLAVVAGAALLVALPDQRPASAAAPNAGSFVAVTPTRVVDTRTGAGGVPKSAVGAGATIAPQIGGQASVPSSSVSAVAVTITSVAPTQVGAVIAWQDGQARPTATNLQYGKGQQVSNLAIVPVSTAGKIDLYNRSTGTVQLVVDVSGYYVGGA